jgi:hypothetical protein
MSSIDGLVVSVVGNEMHREFVLDRIVNHQLVQLPNTPRAKIIPLYGVRSRSSYFLQYCCAPGPVSRS